jgi:hypothetical protein
VAIAYGVNVHAKVRVDGDDRTHKERLCRYLGRPPIAEERLSQMDDGRRHYELKRAWKDGTRAVILSPLNLIARVCALIPAPGFNMVRYHGVLSSRSALRREVVPEPPSVADNPLLPDAAPQLALCFDPGAGEEASGAAKRRPWSWLLRYVWEVDVSRCRLCGGPMKWVEVATEPDAIARVLREVGLPPIGGGAVPRTKRRPTPHEQLGFGFG